VSCLAISWFIGIVFEVCILVDGLGGWVANASLALWYGAPGVLIPRVYDESSLRAEEGLCLPRMS